MLKYLMIVLVFIYDIQAFAAEADSVFDVTEVIEDESAVDDSVFSKIDKSESLVLPSAISEGYYNGAQLIALNKITANSTTITIQCGQAAYFNNAKIELHKCWQSENRANPSSQMLITVTENKFDDDPKVLFRGWLLSNQAAVSTFEHPVYEILAIACVGSKLK